MADGFVMGSLNGVMQGHLSELHEREQGDLETTERASYI